MKAMHKLALFFTSLLCFAATNVVAADKVAQTIRAQTEGWIKSYNAGNVDAIVPLYAEDAVVMPPGVPAMRGRAAIKEGLAKDIAGAQGAGVAIVLGDGDSFGSSGNSAWHSGSYTVKNKAGAVVDSGNYLEVLRKAGGKWVIVRDIWNSDRPPAPAAASK
jgi:ketosteroid isomerase-like protein